MGKPGRRCAHAYSTLPPILTQLPYVPSTPDPSVLASAPPRPIPKHTSLGYNRAHSQKPTDEVSTGKFSPTPLTTRPRTCKAVYAAKPSGTARRQPA